MDSDKKFKITLFSMIGAFIIVVFVLGYDFTNKKTDQVNTVQNSIENNIQNDTLQPEVMINDRPSYVRRIRYQIVDVEYDGEKHQYIEAYNYYGYSLSHWEGCKYCKNNKNR